jgi:hypothetical protein
LRGARNIVSTEAQVHPSVSYMRTIGSPDPASASSATGSMRVLATSRRAPDADNNVDTCAAE